MISEVGPLVQCVVANISVSFSRLVKVINISQDIVTLLNDTSAGYVSNFGKYLMSKH